MKKVMDKYELQKHEILVKSGIVLLINFLIFFVMLYVGFPIEYVLFTMLAMVVHHSSWSIPYLSLRDWRFTPVWLKNLLKEYNYRSEEGKKLKTHNFYDEMYGASVLFLYGGSNEEADVYLERRGFNANRTSHSTAGFCRSGVILVTDNEDSPEIPFFVVWIQNPRSYGVLAHEIFHLVFRVLDNCGLKYSHETEETYAYYQKYWLERIWFFLTRGEDPEPEKNVIRKEPIPTIFKIIS